MIEGYGKLQQSVLTVIICWGKCIYYIDIIHGMLLKMLSREFAMSICFVKTTCEIA